MAFFVTVRLENTYSVEEEKKDARKEESMEQRK
jgi:hypothetical protein